MYYDGHPGTDFAVTVGTEIIAPSSGRLYKANNDPVNGKKGGATPWEANHTFYIVHGDYLDVNGQTQFVPNGYQSWFLHCDRLFPSIDASLEGAEFVDVHRGEPVAYSGNWARGRFGGTGAHLHYELRKDGQGWANLQDPYLENLWASGQPPKTVLFADDFEDGAINLLQWEVFGNTVTETAGEFRVDVTHTNDGGWAKTVPFKIDPSRPLTIKRKLKLHAANRYFDGDFRVYTVNHPDHAFGLSYADYIYTGNGECVTYGFSVFRNGANSHVCASRDTNQSEIIEPIWEQFFEEEIVYDPVSGELKYHIDGELKISYNVGSMPNGADTIWLRIGAWGWWTGHYQHLADIEVSQ